MVYVSELHKVIAKSLYYGPKTAEELRKELGVPLTEVSKVLADLIKIGFIEKKGHPAQYFVTEEMASKIKAQPEQEYDFKGIKLHAIVEGATFNEEELKPQLERLVEQLKENPNFIIHESTIAEPEKRNERYHSFIDLTFSARDFRSIIFFNFFFGPTLVEVLSPSRIEIPMHDFQNGLLDMSEIVHGYVDKITELMSKKELTEFNKKLRSVKHQKTAQSKNSSSKQAK